jgi:hypothetical protein
MRSATRLGVRRWGVSLLAFSLAAGVMLTIDVPSSDALVPTVSLGTAADYGVLGSTTVTNTGATSVGGNVGLWSGTSVTGFPPGVVTPPATIQAGTATAQQAQTDLGLAYIDAASRTIDSATPSELGGQTLVAGVYGTPQKDALTLTGSLVLDGANDPNSVFIFQTDTTLTTASASSVTLINGAQECNVFWQIGSSATLGTGTHLAGNILAFTSITLTTGVVLRGRALAHGAAVTMDTNTITAPTCDLTPPTTTSTTAPVTTTTTSPADTTTTSVAPVTTTTAPAATTTTALPPVTTTTTLPPLTTSTTAPPATTTTSGSATTTTSAPAPSTTTTTEPSASTTTSIAAATVTTVPGPADTRPGSGTTSLRSPPGTPMLQSSSRLGSGGLTGPPRTGGVPLRRTHDWPWLPVLFVLTFIGAGLAALPKVTRR